MALFAAVIIWLLAIVCALPFFLGLWQPPEAITPLARLIDEQMRLTFFLTAIIFLTAHFALGFAVWRFGRKRPGPAQSVAKADRWELLWTAGAATLFLGLALAGYAAWAELRFDRERTAANAEPPLEVEVVGQQFVWNMRYPGADGRFGPIDPRLIDSSLGNPLGVDREHADGADDLVTARLVVPLHREVELILKAKDVLHNFFVPELRLKLDTVPGLVQRLRFKPEKTGTYEIACSELCGLGHYRMRAYMDVKEPDGFEQWLAEQASYLE